MLESGVHIPSLDGKDIYISNSYLVPKVNDKGLKIGYKLRDQNGDLNLKRFINTLDYSLDLIKMQEVYESVYRRRDFSFNKNGKDYTQRVINVTFKYNNKAFNRIRNGVYVKFGYAYEDLLFKDCIAMQDGVLVGIEVDIQVENPVPNDVLGKCFYYEDGMYKAKSNIPILNSVANIREELYKNGFLCDGIRYVRFKRSAGSSRVGKCLFIDERLYRQMHKWEMCGIKVKRGQDIDLAALEPYIALTLSSIIDTIQIHPENILVVKDYKSVFRDRVVATRFVDGRLVSKVEDVEIGNSIWDGQSLMDRSVFLDFQKQQQKTNPDVREHGMLLLRARFFKSCCFNANIQQWFSDNGITDVGQLNGVTTAKRIEDIKLITTLSSIKYVKFGKLEDWLNTLESTFGVVKHEKPTHFFNGRMVQTHYQLLNTLQMTYDEVERLVKPSLDYARMIKIDIAVMRHQIGYQYQSFNEDFYNKAITSKNDIIYRMLGLTDKFAETKIYQQFRDDLVKSFIKNLRLGHLLVQGNYSTICGNPIEMLKQAIGVFDGSSVIEKGTVHSTRFENHKELLGSRSPHVTMGNILVTRNVLRSEINRYMNPTKEIVYINSINENILERLSGADFDSDTVMLTDNEILVQAAKRNYDRFPVPTKLVESETRQRKYTDIDKADLDIKTSINKIGEIINLSQELNSILWDRLYHGASIDSVMELYCDIAQLDVMSNLEIDSAKRENPADNTFELQCLKKKYDLRDKKGRHIRPLFFRYIDGYKGYRDGYYIYVEEDGEYVKQGVVESYKEAKKLKDNENVTVERGRMTYKKHETSMDYLELCINRFRNVRSKNGSKIEGLPFSSCLIPAYKLNGQVRSYQVKRIIDCANEFKQSCNDIWNSEELSLSEKRKIADCLKDECVRYINSMTLDLKTMRHLLAVIESKELSKISKFLFYVCFQSKDGQFYDLLEQSRTQICKLKESADGNIHIYDFTYSLELVQNSQKWG
ncbi:hypothetical protein [Flintibacter muris]|uniref:hypothetical protein n=1 Tax=Flintibacter muris TaxID=2941327 RepID=UPI00203CC08D|nr:hypothetical protein [Flintibacter muris]